MSRVRVPHRLPSFAFLHAAVPRFRPKLNPPPETSFHGGSVFGCHASVTKKSSASRRGLLLWGVAAPSARVTSAPFMPRAAPSARLFVARAGALRSSSSPPSPTIFRFFTRGSAARQCDTRAFAASAGGEIGALRRGSRRAPPRRFPAGNLPRGRFAPRGEKPRRYRAHPFFGVGEKRKRLYSFLHYSGLREIATANLQRQFHSRP